MPLDKLTLNKTPYTLFALHVLNCCKARTLLSFGIFPLAKIL